MIREKNSDIDSSGICPLCRAVFPGTGYVGQSMCPVLDIAPGTKPACIPAQSWLWCVAFAKRGYWATGLEGSTTERCHAGPVLVDAYRKEGRSTGGSAHTEPSLTAVSAVGSGSLNVPHLGHFAL